MSIKRRLVRFDKKRVFLLFILCAACLSASLLMHVQFPIYMRNGTDVFTSARVLNLNAFFNSIQFVMCFHESKTEWRAR